MNLKTIQAISPFVLALILLGFTYSYLSNSKIPLDYYHKKTIKVPVRFEVVDCEGKCKDWIEFKHRTETFKFYQSNPFYYKFEQVITSSGYMQLWYDPESDNRIHQVSLNREIVISNEKLYNVYNFDDSMLFILPLVVIAASLSRFRLGLKK